MSCKNKHRRRVSTSSTYISPFGSKVEPVAEHSNRLAPPLLSISLTTKNCKQEEKKTGRPELTVGQWCRIDSR